jgi:hypothetical protein
MTEDFNRSPLLSIEGVITLIAAFFFWEAEVNWELRCLGVFVTSVLAVHAASRMEISLRKKAALTFVLVVVLLSSTWRPIWVSFHEDFPSVTGETVLSRIIVFAALGAAGLAGHVFLMRPRRDGRRLIPAQLMAFGVSMIAAGFIAAAIGLLWQFQQNRAMGITVANGPNLLPAPNTPQIAQALPPQALPSPSQASSSEPLPQPNPHPAPQPATQPQPATPLMSGYNLSGAGSRVLADEAFKIKGVLTGLTVLLQNNDNSGRSLATAIVRALSIGGIPSTLNFGQLGGPTETGPIILFDDPDNLPPAATALKKALEKVGMRVTVIKRAVGTFQFFIGPDPDS